MKLLYATKKASPVDGVVILSGDDSDIVWQDIDLHI